MTAKPYDPTLKALVETEPESWPRFFGRPTGPTRVIDADVATVSGAADKVLHVAATPPYLLHLEFVAGHDVADLPSKLHVRNALLADRHQLPVRSEVILLHKKADSPQLDGKYEVAFPGEEPYLTFRYHVTRVWELEPEPLLTTGLAVLPLSPISKVTEAELPGIIRRMDRRLRGKPKRQTEVLWGAAYILLGLRYTPALAKHLFGGVVSMKESSTYQAILEEGRAEGRAEEARRLLRVSGDRQLGVPDDRTKALIEGIDDLARLEDLFDRLPSVSSWQELLGEGSPTPRKRRRKQSPES